MKRLLKPILNQRLSPDYFQRSFIVLLLILGLQGMHAETTLVVKQKVGINTSFNLSTFRSLTFGASTVTVNTNDAGQTSFARANVQYINFVANNANEIDQIDGKEITQLTLFPNPVINVLNIICTSENSQNIQLEIVGYDGKIVLKKHFDIFTGSLSVETLPHGFYICRIITQTKIQTQKFIKQ